MVENEYVYRVIDPKNVEDIKKYLNIRDELNDFLNKKVKPLTEDQIKWLRIRMGAIELLPEHQQNSEYALGLIKKPDEICIVCEEGKQAIGYIYVNTYNVKDGERTNDDVGIISDIFVKEEFRGNSEIALNLLKRGVQKLIDCGKFRAICNVQEDNRYRYLHFAMADGNVIHKDQCKRKDGSETIDYTLMIDLKRLNTDIEKGVFVRRIGKYHLETTRNNLKATI